MYRYHFFFVLCITVAIDNYMEYINDNNNNYDWKISTQRVFLDVQPIIPNTTKYIIFLFLD